MCAQVALSSLLALGAAQYLPYAGYGYSTYNPYPFYAGAYNYAPSTYAATPYAAVPAASVSSQYHAQDELGQFNYGYADGLSSKYETRRFDGATSGGYSYIDADGKLQSVSYTADDVNGFQVKATNLPVAPVADLAAPEFNLEAPVFDGKAPEPVQDTPEVAAAKAEFAKLYADAAAAAAAEPAEQESARRKRSAVLLPALAKATFKTASLDKVEADTPADTTLLKLKEKEHETYVHTAYAAPAFHYTPAVTYTTPLVKKVEIKKVEAPITYAATPFTYGFHPYGVGAPFVYNVAAVASEAKEESAEEPAVVSAERRKRSAVLVPAVAKATFKTASLDKVEADTPADTTLLKLKEKEHETYVHTAYAAPAFHYTPAVTYTVPEVKKVEVKHVAAPAFTYAAPFSHFTPVVKKVEVKNVDAPITYAATPLTYGFHPYGVGAPFVYNVAAVASEAKEESAEEPAVVSAERRKRSAVLLPALAKATFKTASLDKVEADTPADTTLLKLKEKEHETYVHTAYAAPAFHYTPAVTYTTPLVKKVEVKHVAAPAFTYAAPFSHFTPVVKKVEVKKVEAPITYSAVPFPYAYGLGSPLVYNVAAKTAEVEEKAE